jgi:hypothetical protein
MRYVPRVDKVFHTLADIGRGNLSGGVSLTALGSALGFEGLTYEAFVAREKPARALMTAMDDLDKIGVVEFKNVGHGNSLTPNGRDVADAGLMSVSPEIFAIPASEAERTFLARLYAASAQDGDGWADLQFVDADLIYAECGFPTEEYADTMARFQFYADLERKGLARAEHHTIGSPNTFRPTYLSAVLVSEADPRHGGTKAGIIDWSMPTPGFEPIEERLADLKVKLEGSVTDADLSDIGLRCRSLLVDIVRLVYRSEMVPAGVEPPSPQDADEMLGFYLAARLPGKDNEAHRKFLRGARALAGARVHSDRTGRAAAVAAAQGVVSFLRGVQAIERVARSTDNDGRNASPGR